MATLKQRLHRKNAEGTYDVTTAEDFFTTPKIPVLTADPSNPVEGQIWVLKT